MSKLLKIGGVTEVKAKTSNDDVDAYHNIRQNVSLVRLYYLIMPYLNKGLIRPSYSPFISVVILVDKEDNSLLYMY